jgi:hypothetical protein
MNIHRCKSEKSLITVQKWLLEAGDCPSTSFCVRSSKLDNNIQQKLGLNKINKRKRVTRHKYNSKTTSIIDWFYEFIKSIFTIYDENHLKCNEQIYHQEIDDAHMSVKTYSTYPLENLISQLDKYIQFFQFVIFIDLNCS